MCTKEESNKKWSEMDFRQKVYFLYENTTVEPLMACYIIPSFLAAIASQNLNLEKACRVNLNYTTEVCDTLTARQTDNYTIEETQVQQLVAGMSVWRTFVQSLIPGVLIMFLGSWSDRKRRRKPFMMLPVIGEFLSSMSLIVCTFFFYQLPMEVSGFFECFWPAVTGGWMTMNMAVFSYLGDITTVEDRTLRIGIVNVFATAGVPIGLGLSGLLFKSIGFYGIYSIAISLYIVGLTCAYFNIRDIDQLPVIPKVDSVSIEKDHLESLKETTNNTQVLRRGGAITYFIKDFFDIQHIKETFAIVFKDGPNNRKKKILLLIVVLVSLIGPWHGEMTVIYLFMRYRFNWDEVQFSIFSTYSVITHLIGTTFSVGVFSHMLQIDDALIGVVSCMSKILAGFVYAFARTEWQVYLAPLVDIMNGTSFIAMRSIASKLVPAEELGKLNSLYGACEALTPLLYGPMYAFVYAHTMDTMPGAFFLLGGALTMPAVIIFGWMYTQHRGDRLRPQNSRKSSVAEDVLKSLRVDPLVMTPTMLNSSDSTQGAELNGEVNSAFQEDKL